MCKLLFKLNRYVMLTMFARFYIHVNYESLCSLHTCVEPCCVAENLSIWCDTLWYGLFSLQVCLEHAFHLLCNGLIDEAYQNLSLAESWRSGEQTAIQDKEMKLIQAYRALLDYYSWAKQKNILLEHGKCSLY